MLRGIRFLFAGVLMLALAACHQPKAESRKTLDEMLALRPVQQQAFKCQNIEALIPEGHSVEGKTCPENKAVVNGWSETCVAQGQCNTPARLGEVNGAAEKFCADWCAKKKCDYKYTSRTKCSSSWCMNSDDCQKNCNLPLLDACFFQEATPNYNCECKDKVEG